MKLTLICIVPLCVCAAYGAEVEIDSMHHNGTIVWHCSETTGVNHVQWAPSLTGTWSRTWSPDLSFIEASGESRTSAVPMFLRVVWAPGTTNLFVDIRAPGDGTKNGYSGTTAHYPIIPGTLTVYFPSHDTLSDNGDGTLTGTNGGSGLIIYDTGQYSVVLGDVLPPAFNLFFSYHYLLP